MDYVEKKKKLEEFLSGIKYYSESCKERLNQGFSDSTPLINQKAEQMLKLYGEVRNIFIDEELYESAEGPLDNFVNNGLDELIDPNIILTKYEDLQEVIRRTNITIGKLENPKPSHHKNLNQQSIGNIHAVNSQVNISSGNSSTQRNTSVQNNSTEVSPDKEEKKETLWSRFVAIINIPWTIAIGLATIAAGVTGVILFFRK